MTEALNRNSEEWSTGSENIQGGFGVVLKGLGKVVEAIKWVTNTAAKAGEFVGTVLGTESEGGTEVEATALWEANKKGENIAKSNPQIRQQTQESKPQTT